MKGGVGDEEAVAELLEGADVVLSFLGMVDPKLGPVVRPGVEHIIAGLKKVAAGEIILRRHRSHPGVQIIWSNSRCRLHTSAAL